MRAGAGVVIGDVFFDGVLEILQLQWGRRHFEASSVNRISCEIWSFLIGGNSHRDDEEWS